MVKRIVTAIIGMPIIIAILLFANNYIFSAIITIVSIITLMEYFNAFKKNSKPVQWLGYLSCLLIMGIQFVPEEWLVKCIAITIPTICAILFTQIVVTNMKTTVKDACVTLFGIVYVVGFLIFLPQLFGMENGRFLIWYIFVASWGNDGVAYFVGSRFGKHKVTSISPNKTLEGCIGGIIGGTLMAEILTYVFNTMFSMNFSYLYAGLIIAVLTIISQIGDLAASAIKRYTNIKDSGNLFPGHGGMLDRIDSILFIAPFAYFLLMLI